MEWRFQRATRWAMGEDGSSLLPPTPVADDAISPLLPPVASDVAAAAAAAADAAGAVEGGATLRARRTGAELLRGAVAVEDTVFTASLAASPAASPFFTSGM